MWENGFKIHARFLREGVIITLNHLYLLFPLSNKNFHINYILQKKMSCSKITLHKLFLIYIKT
jgi:hypothetical protein